MTFPSAAVQARFIALQNLHFVQIPPPAEAHGPPRLQVRLHYIWICTKKGRKARRREGDKCFLKSF